MNNENIKALLQKRNLKATSSRLRLLTEMERHGYAMSYSSIQSALKPINRVTLYRTIESLKKKVLFKAFQENNDIYYAICGNSCKENNTSMNMFTLNV